VNQHAILCNDHLSPILLVEDRATDLDLTKRAFAKRRLLNPIQIARSGEEALEFIPRWEAGEPTPVFVLLDLKLPKIDGLEVLRCLRNHVASALIPVIILTSSADDEDIQEAYRLGCNSYIVKPVEFNKFMEVTSKVNVYWSLTNTAPR
jgi:CheY-like chemotaxis protein